jgi:hypothetical protein
MPDVSLFLPNGLTKKYTDVAGVQVDKGVVIFYSHPSSKNDGKKRVQTSLPFLMEEDQPAD